MQRRGGSGQPVKGQRHRTIRPKTRKAPTAPASADHSAEQFDRLKRERDEALEQLAATAEILSVISSSPADTQPVFDCIVQSGLKLFPNALISVALRDGDTISVAAIVDADPDRAEAWRRTWPIPLRGDYFHGAAILDCRIVDIPDVKDAPAEFAAGARNFLTSGYRAITIMPMMRSGEAIGLLSVVRLAPGPLSDKQLAVLRTFAAQAVIAIENTRLLNELRQRTDDLSESLEQQTATSEVLKVISSSPGELKPVFDALLANAVRICDAKFGVLFLSEGDAFRYVALHGAPPAFAEARRREPVTRVKPGTTIGRVAATKKPAQTADIRAEPAYTSDPERIPILELAGARTILGVPMLKESQLVGAIVIYRQEVRPFTDKQIDLLSNFAAQAVIAIENARLLNELRQRTDDLSESLEQQTATTGVLKTISSSPGELEPVFDAILENAVRICGAKFGSLVLFEANAYRRVALHNGPPAYVEARARDPVRPLAASPTLSRVAATKQVVQVADMAVEQPEEGIVRLGGARTVLAVPMLNDDRAVGVISIYRQDVRPFTDKQTELVKNFAAQAVIAIENTRLLSELRESLQQQTATADVLKVISRSTFDLQGVLDTLVESAARLCRAERSAMRLVKDNLYHEAAMYNHSQQHKERMLSEPLKPGRGSVTGRVVLEGKSVHVIDAQADPDPGLANRSRSGNVRTILGVPLLREGTPIGVLLLQRSIVQSFTYKEIELAETFADQAAIAIENVRLFDEVQARTRDLTEALEQQTATSEVLQVISASPGQLEPVFKAMLGNAVRTCGAKFGIMYLSEGDGFRTVAMHDVPRAFAEKRQREPFFRPAAGSPMDRIVRTRQVAHISDITTVQGYVEGDRPLMDLAQLGGARTVAAVPMLKESELVGAIIIYRQEVRPFTDKQIELVQNFAAQAVIAIENTRLLSELRESLQQQTATADVLKVISRSTFDLQTVLQTLVESAGRLCNADKATITRQKDGAFYLAEGYGFSREFMDYIRTIPIKAERGSASGRALLEGRVVHISDVTTDPEYTWAEAQRLGDFRATLAVPMLREGIPIGVLALSRSEVRPFTDKQIELVTTFADQAAIAIENVRLFESVEARTRELAASLEDLRTTQDRLVQTQKLASLGQLTAGIAHEIKNPLNFVNNFSGVSAELIDELQEALKDVSLGEKRRGEITELMDTLRGNLDKVVQHGKRADAIVKNMLLHSREGSGEHRLIDINALVEESLNLAYHGARAEKQGFNITLQRSLDPAAGGADVFPQDITRVLLNLISNGFYAATKRRAETNGGDYEPTLAAATRSLGDRVEITIRDNGTGIPPDVKDKMFNPFFTTKPAGEGTGLGLSISHDIIVKQHGGSIEVDTQPGEFSEFRIILPRAAVFLVESGGRV